MDHRDPSPAARACRLNSLDLTASSLVDIVPRTVAIALVVAHFAAASPANADANDCLCGTFVQVDRIRDSHPGACDPTVYSCFNNGQCYPGDVCIEGACVAAGTPHKTYFYQTLFCCEDGRALFQAQIPAFVSACGEGPSRLGEVTAYGCDPACSLPDETKCNGRDDDGDGYVDEGCVDEACSDADKDDHPVRFSSGRVETNPITPFSLPAPSDVFFGVKVRWGSHTGHRPGPLFDNDGAIDFYGDGFVDAWGDRLRIANPSLSAPDPFPPSIEWESFSSAARFDRTSLTSNEAHYVSDDGEHELIATSSGYRVIGRHEHIERTFRALTYAVPLNPSKRGVLGVLTQIRASGYVLDVRRDLVTGRLESVVDSFGRTLTFVHETLPRFSRVKEVRYSAAGQTAIVVARFVYADDDAWVLSRVERGAGGYTRLRMLPLSICTDCRGLVAEVIEQVRDGSPGDAYAPAAAHERVIEGHTWDLSNPGRRPIAKGSHGPARRWAYRAEDTAACAQTGLCRRQQIDLQTGTGATCSADADCGVGHACWEGACYEVTTIEYERATRRVRTVSTPNGEDDVNLVYDAAGRLKARIDAQGVRTTTTYDPDGDIACHVIDDDDDDAGLPPTCDAPPGAWMRSVVQNGFIEIERTPGELPGSAGRTVETERDAEGHVVRVTTTGETRDIDGVRIVQTSSERRAWDAYGRLSLVTRTDEPGFRDRTHYTYHSANAGFDAGQLFEEIREVGPPTSPRREVTTHLAYDAWGEPHTINRADGVVVTRSFSPDRRTVWTTSWAGGLSPETSRETRHFDGSPHVHVDATGVCTTFEERADARVVQRSRDGSATCGVLPIDVNREHVDIEWTMSNRPTDVSGHTALYFGSVFEDADFVVDTHGRMTHTLVDSVVVETQTHGVDGSLEIGEGACPGPSCIITRRLSDHLFRTTSIERVRGDGHTLTTTFGIPEAMLTPDTLTRGLDGSSTLRSNFVEDDFARLVEATPPDAAPTRTEYGADDRVLLERSGADSDDESTTRTVYDAFRRPIRIDHDIEHPVDCASAPSGTAVADVELVYDACPGAPSGFVCRNALNRVAVERAILSCAQGTTWSRAEYFSYDTFGRVVAQAVAFEQGATVVEWLPATHVVGADGVYTTVGNPVGAGLGTTVTPSTTNLVSSTLSTTEPYMLGSLDQTRPGLPLTGGYFGGRFLISASFDHRGLPEARSFRDWGRGIDHLDAFYTYDAAGRQTRREDESGAGAAGANRFLLRDGIGRLTCEDVDDAGCSGALFGATYTDETIDQRSTQSASPPWFPHTTGTFTATHALAYEPGTSRIAAATSTNDTTTLEHDDRGRRTAEHHSSAPTEDRVYAYLPDGRLGGVRGTHAGAPYAITLHYDARSRPVRVVDTISGATDDFFYGPTGELIGARRSGIDAPMVGLTRFDDGTFLSVFADDTWSLGGIGDLASLSPRQPVSLPSFGGPAGEVVAIATTNSARSIVVYFAGGYAFTGDLQDDAGRLTFTYASWYLYSLAPGQSAATVVDIERDPLNGRFTAWYTNGTYSQGTISSLSSVSSNTPYATQLPVSGVALKLGARNSKGTRLPSVAYAFHDGGVLLTGTTTSFDGSFAQLRPPVGANGPQRLGFHRVAGELVAITRQSEQRTQRFYVVTDEGGVPLTVVDDRGIVHADAHTSAFGWTSPRVKPSVWLPFALPGQIVLEQTRSAMHPPLSLNGARTYDPWSGRFLEPDPADVLPRDDPEGYVLARNDPTYWADPTGTVSFHESCSESQQAAIKKYARAAMNEIRERCAGLLCKDGVKKWTNGIWSSFYACAPDDRPLVLRRRRLSFGTRGGWAYSWPPYRVIDLPPERFEDLNKIYDRNAGCFKRMIAHEGRHIAYPGESDNQIYSLNRCTTCP